VSQRHQTAEFVAGGSTPLQVSDDGRGGGGGGKKRQKKNTPLGGRGPQPGGLWVGVFPLLGYGGRGGGGGGGQSKRRT